MFIIYYLLVGVGIMFVLDVHLSVHKDEIKELTGEDMNYDNATRIFMIVAWPALVIIMIRRLLM